MTCPEAEILICDYLDGTLDRAHREELQHHLRMCKGCGDLARDAGSAVAFMERVADVEPPPELLTRILFDAPWSRHRSPAVTGGRGRGWLGSLLHPVLQPRLVMGMAMTILFVSMLARYVAPARQLRPADLDPVKVWAALDDRVYRVWERTVKFYDSLRFVYQVQSTLRDWRQQQEQEQTAAPDDAARQGADERRLPVGKGQRQEPVPPGNTR